MANFAQLLQGYCLTTVEIVYRLPDFPTVLQSFVWQEYDLPPSFPNVRRFLDFWAHSIEGQLFSVRVSCADTLKVPQFSAPITIWHA